MNEKKKYISPEISVYDVVIEYSFAASSVAQIHVNNDNGFIDSEWQRTDISADLDW